MGFIFPNKSKVLEVTKINHDVVSLKIVKPFKFQHKVGQVVDLSIDKPGFELAVATFTIVNLPTDNHLEFIIKVYNNFNGLTKGISELVPVSLQTMHIIYRHLKTLIIGSLKTQDGPLKLSRV